MGKLTSAVNFFRESWAELGRVKWPTRKEIVSYTIVVLITCVIMAALTFGVDIGIARLLKLIGLGVQ
ncbi:MAG: preprotein translocase subunit SecE [Bacilli bacterium]|nr:preprotein translocase subunit SecE [Bacilli bacterium]